MRHSNASNYWGTQIAWGWEDNANRLATRNVTGGSFGSWVYYLNSANFTSYAPSLTGTGASGTWGINITGNAVTATTWQTPRTLTIGNTGRSVNGSANVSWSVTDIDNTIVRNIGNITTQDWNTYIDGTEASWLGVSNHSGANRPSSSYTYGAVLNLSTAAQAKFQLYAPETASDGNGLWYRTGWDTTYRQWGRIWDNINLSNPVIGTGTANYVALWNGTNSICNSAGLSYTGLCFIAQGRITMGSNFNSNSGLCSTVTGGLSNTIGSTNNYSFIGAGCNNTINAGVNRGFIGGGSVNSIVASSSDNAIVGGCANNVAAGNCSFIGGGFANNVGNSYASVVGGFGNCACGGCTFVGGGFNNKAIGSNVQCASIVGGNTNCIADACHNGFIGGGCNNCIYNNTGCNAILGGKINRLCHNDTFIIGSNITSTANCYTFVNNLCSFGALSSDVRLKENISNVPYGLCEVKQLEPVRYSFKNDESKTLKYGFLAQCIQQIMPDLITTHPTDLIEGEPVLQFDKEAIWSSLVNAIKQQQIQIDELKAEIELLKNS
jgi:hypothetical protein